MKRYFIVGYYGNANFGDEVMLDALLDKLGKDSRFIVTSGDFSIPHPNVEYVGLHSLLSDQTRSKAGRFISALRMIGNIVKNVDRVYIGGGTLIKNNLSINLLFLWIAFACKIYGKGLELISVGMERLSPLNRNIYDLIFKLSESILVRDSYSLSQCPKASLIEDLAIQKFKTIRVMTKEKALIIAPALFAWDDLEQKKEEYIRFIQQQNRKTVLVSSQNLDRKSDLQLCEAISKQTSCEIFHFKNSTSVESFPYYGDILSERYHIGILSAFLHSTLALTGTSQKIRTLASELNVNVYDTLASADPIAFKTPDIKGIMH